MSIANDDDSMAYTKPNGEFIFVWIVCAAGFVYNDLAWLILRWMSRREMESERARV